MPIENVILGHVYPPKVSHTGIGNKSGFEFSRRETTCLKLGHEHSSTQGDRQPLSHVIGFCCGTRRHGRAGQATKDGDKGERLYVPTGTCDKIAGARLYQAKK